MRQAPRVRGPFIWRQVGSDTDTDMSDVGDIENRTWVYRCRWRDLGSTDRYTSVGHYGRLYAA